MKIAEIAESPVILVGDIDKGGIFASFYGTVKIIPIQYRDYFRGLFINKFRGDKSLLDTGIKWIEKKLDIPVLGVIPYYRDIILDEEDSVNLEKEMKKSRNYGNTGYKKNNGFHKNQYVYLPHISNFYRF